MTIVRDVDIGWGERFAHSVVNSVVYEAIDLKARLKAKKHAHGRETTPEDVKEVGKYLYNKTTEFLEKAYKRSGIEPPVPLVRNPADKEQQTTSLTSMIYWQSNSLNRDELRATLHMPDKEMALLFSAALTEQKLPNTMHDNVISFHGSLGKTLPALMKAMHFAENCHKVTSSEAYKEDPPDHMLTQLGLREAQAVARMEAKLPRGS